MSLDLNVCFETAAALETAKDLGYRIIAISKTVPASSEVRAADSTSSLPQTDGAGMTVLRRITLALSSVAQLSVLAQLYCNRKGFDIIAARPLNDTVLKALCDKGACDIISLDLSASILSSGLRSSLKSAIDRGVSIEVEFGTCLRDISCRTSMVSQCMQFLSSFSKGVVVSSGARNVLEMRSPVDLQNFAKSVLGLKSDSQKEAADCLKRAIGRIRGHVTEVY